MHEPGNQCMSNESVHEPKSMHIRLMHIRAFASIYLKSLVCMTLFKMHAYALLCITCASSYSHACIITPFLHEFCIILDALKKVMHFLS